MKRLNLERGKEELISTGGNHACGYFLREAARRHLPANFQQRREGAISDRDILLTMTGMLSNSRTDFVDVDLYREDTVFTHSFGIDELPAEPTLRQRLDELPAQRSHDCLRTTNLSILQGRSFQTVRAGELDLVPVDIDVSPLDNSGSNKQGVSFTYKKHDGYAPIFAYIGAEGYMLDHELRPGKQHCQEGTPQFIGSCVRQLEALKLRGRCLIRLDSEQLPSSKLCVNKIVLLCGMLAFNVLRTLGQEVLARAHLAPVKIKVRRWRLKTVLQNIVYCAVRVIRHARTIKLHFGKTCPWFDVIEDVARSRLCPD